MKLLEPDVKVVKPPKKKAFNFWNIGEDIRRFRKMCMLSIEELAAIAGIHYVTLWSLESGAHLDPGVKIVQKLFDVMGVKITFHFEPDSYADQFKRISKKVRQVAKTMPKSKNYKI